MESPGSDTYCLIDRCRGCHAFGKELRTVLEMEPMPLAGMFCEEQEEAANAPLFPLTWAHCRRCGLVQVLQDVSDSLLFSKYNYASSTVPGLVRHFRSFAELLVRRYVGRSQLRFLEIGCNDGVLLNQLPQGWHLLGWDPSDVALNAAIGNLRYELVSLPFNLSTVESIGLEGEVDVVSGSNCLAHISDLREVFKGVWRVLRPGGHFWIEVHDLRALLRGGQWDTIYHEHKAEWSEEALRRCLASIGFGHRETTRTPMHGGALRVCFEKESKPRRRPPETVQPEAEVALLRRAYEGRYESSAARQLMEATRRGHAIAGYGASGRANVYLNQMNRLHFEYVVDEAPLRMNKFLPRVRTPVVPRAWLEARPVAICLVTAWNYRADIVLKNPKFRGTWLSAFGAEQGDDTPPPVAVL